MKKCLKCCSLLSLEHFSKDRGKLDGLRNACKACQSRYFSAWRELNSAHQAERLRIWYLNADKEKLRPKKRASHRRWRARNVEKERVRRAMWKQNNKALVNDATRRRQTKLVHAMPRWANKTAIKTFYQLARRRTEETGMAWHVDHIVPLRSQIVCGLHVEANLQVIPANENHKKYNRYWPDMPEPPNA